VDSVRGFLPRGLCDTCPPVVVVHRSAPVSGQVSHNPKQERKFVASLHLILPNGYERVIPQVSHPEKSAAVGHARDAELTRNAGLVSGVPAIGFREMGRIPGLCVAPLDPPVSRNILIATPKRTYKRPNVKAVISLLCEAVASQPPPLKRAELV